VKSGPAASTPKTRAGQRAASPHSRTAIDANSAADTIAAAATSGTFPTSDAGR
jgi:hypothetical protein